MPFAAVVRIIAMTSKLNVLLIFVPVGITLNFIPGMPAVLVFACNTIALVPLSSLLSYATECIASELGDTIGALINISLGNLIELITLFVALKDGKVHIVQGALVGSILVNLLLVLGCAIIVGDFLAADLEQQFDVSHAQALACLLALSVMSILIPVCRRSLDFCYLFCHMCLHEMRRLASTTPWRIRTLPSLLYHP